MSTGKHVPTAAESFDAIAADPASLRSFLACIGSSAAASRMRAAGLICESLCNSVVDAGCGPGLFFRTLADVCVGTLVPQYVGVDPVAKLLAIAADTYTLPIEPVIRTSPCAFGPGWSTHYLVHGDPLAQLAGAERCADAVLLRHVVEHVPDPLPLLRAAARAARRLVVVVVSQETRSAGIPRSLLTDTHLGALRWSHWRPDLLAMMAREEPSWSLYAHEQGPPLVVREELFAWVRA